MEDIYSEFELDKWLITAMSHMRVMYEDNGILWTHEDEAIFQHIRLLIKK